MDKTILSAVILASGVTAAATYAVSAGPDSASARTLFAVTASAGESLATLIQSKTGVDHMTTEVLDGAVGISFTGVPGDNVFVTVAGAPAAGVTVVAAVVSGTVARTRSDASGGGFIAGVALGVALGSA